MNIVKDSIDNIQVRKLFRFLNHNGRRSWLWGLYWASDNESESGLESLNNLEIQWNT